MATEILSGPLGEVRAASTAGGGTALTSSAQRIVLPRGTKQITLIPRNFSTAVVVKFNKNPFLTIIKTSDLLATQANMTDYSDNAQDGSTSTKVTLSSLGTSATSFIYVGAATPFGGVEIDVAATNSNASVLTVKYRKSDDTWADISATDGTASAGATMAQDANVTWTVPTDWKSAKLFETGDSPLHLGVTMEEMFWTRWEVSIALDSTTDQNSWIAINRSTTYAEIPLGLGWTEAVSVGPGGIFSITALTDAGTANLIVNCATRSAGRF